MAGYSTSNVILGGGDVAVSAPSDSPITHVFKISESDADNFMIAVKCSGTSGTVNIQIQHAWNIDEGFVDIGSTVVAADGTVQLAITGPIWPIARVVAADGGGSTTVEAVYISRRT